MSHSVFSQGSCALISGAASGIGLAIAKRCRKQGMKVILVDRNAEALETAKAELLSGHQQLPPAAADNNDEQVAAQALDVAKPADWLALKELVEKRFGSIQLLVLNAGVYVRNASWENGDYFRETLETNLFGVINGINAFLPVIQEASKTLPTSIVITGSKQGITNPPGNPAYNASKAAVKTLAEHLSYDLRETSTSVHLLVPGWTFTGLTGGKEKPAGAWTADQVADYLHEKMAQNQFYIICPDNDVTEEMDKKRMTWSVGDAVHRRQPLSRWRNEYKEEAEKTMAEMEF